MKFTEDLEGIIFISACRGYIYIILIKGIVDFQFLCEDMADFVVLSTEAILVCLVYGPL